MPLSTGEIEFHPEKPEGVKTLYLALKAFLFWFIPTALMGKYLFEKPLEIKLAIILFLFFFGGFSAAMFFFRWADKLWIIPRLLALVAVEILFLPIAHRNGLFENSEGFIVFLGVSLLMRAFFAQRLIVNKRKLSD